MVVDQMPALQSADRILKEYRALDCACCNNFFGYVHRQTGEIFCSSPCVSVGPKSSPFVHTFVPVPASPILLKEKNEKTGTEVRTKKTEDVVDHCPPPPKDRSDISSATPCASLKIEERKPVPATNKGKDSEKTPLSKKESVEPAHANPFMKQTAATPKIDKTPAVPEKNPFPKENVKTPPVTEKNPFPKENVKTLPVTEKNPFPKENVKTPAVIEKKALCQEDVEERNPFLKGSVKSTSGAEKNPFPKTDMKSAVVAEKKEFPKENVKVPVAHEKRDAPKEDVEMPVERNPFSKGSVKIPEVEKNPFPNAKVEMGKESVHTPPSKNVLQEKKSNSENVAKKEEKVPTTNEIIVEANAIVLKLRSELAWSPEPENSLGKPMKGSKCYFISPTDFFFQTASMTEKLATLQADLAKFCSTAKMEALESLNLGQLVFAKFSGEMFRGEIIGIPRADVAEIFFIDYGNTEQIPRQKLSALTEQFYNVPRCCFHCQWDFALAAKQSDTNAKVSEGMNDTDDVTPILKVADGQYVVAIGPKVQDVQFSVKSFYAPGKVPLKITARPVAKRTPAVVELPRKKYMFKDSEYSPALADGAEVKISFAWSDINYLIMSPIDEQELTNMQFLANANLDKTKKLKSRPDIGEVVLAPYGEEVYRAKVLFHDEKAKDMVTVVFFDFGDSAKLKFGDLYEITDEVMKHPIYAMNCVLDGVPDPKGIVNVDKEISERMGGVLQLQIKNRPVGDSDVFLVNLWNGEETMNSVIKRAVEAHKN